jgi:cyclic pyranopterin monophosphate synthase
MARPAVPFSTIACQMSDLTFTHLDPMGRARMVDVTPKEPTHRRAVARCKVFMQPETTAAIANREVKKGDVLAVARVAGIQAAKRTSDMIPLCHPLLVGAVNLNFEIGDDFIAVEANVDTVDRTGVEMEALHACAVAALTIYDMCKSADRGMVIGDLALWEKTGGRSGVYRRAAETTSETSGETSQEPLMGDDLAADVSDTVTNVVDS